MVGRDQDAADIVQEAYACALQGFSQFRGDNPSAWLLTIVRNTVHSWLTINNRQEEVSRSDEDPHAGPRKIILLGLSEERQRQLLEEALKRLPAEFREVLLLFEIERWPYQEIAAALDVRLEVVVSRLNSARRRLRAELAFVDQVIDWRGDGLSRTGGVIETGGGNVVRARGQVRRNVSQSMAS